MAEENLIDKAKDFIEARLLHSRKKFEIIVSVSKDPAKKDSLVKTIGEIDQE